MPGNNQIIEKDTFESFDFERFLHVLSNSKFWIAGIIIIFITVSYLYVRYTKPVYESESTIKLEFESEANVLGLADAWNTKDVNEISGEIELLKSKLFLSRVAEAAGLEVSYHVYGRALTDERYKNSPFAVSSKIYDHRFHDFPFDVELSDESFQLEYELDGEVFRETYKYGEEIRTAGFNLLVQKTEYFDSRVEEDYFFTINSHDALVNYFENRINVMPENLNAKTIKIALWDHSRIKARDLVNLIDVLYLTYTKEVKNQVLEKQIEFLNEQIAATEKKLQQFEDYFEDFIITNRTTNLNRDLSRTITRLDALDSQRFNLQSKINEVSALRKQINENNLGILNPVSSETLPDALQKSLNEYRQLVPERELKLGSYNETSYVIQKYDLKLATIKSNLFLLIEAYDKNLNERVKLINNRRASLEGSLLELPSMGTEYSKNRRFYSLQEEFMLSLQQSKIELEITRAGTLANSVILSPASLPSIPKKPRKFLIMAAGFISSLVICLIFLLIRYMFHNKITGIKELEKLIDVPLLGSIPFYAKEPLIQTSLVIKKDSKSSLSEALRTIRTNLDFVNRDNTSKLISVTSTVSGEGKTFVAANLGAIISISDQKVCVLDMDMRKPKVHLAFGAPPSSKGLSTILAGKNDLKNCIQETEIKNLFFVSAGSTPPNPSELLLQKGFDELLYDLRKKFDTIILDTPPVGLVTDARIAMRKSDLQLYIVRADYSKRTFCKVVNDLKHSVQFANIAVVFNSVRSNDRYGYGYYDDEQT